MCTVRVWGEDLAAGMSIRHGLTRPIDLSWNVVSARIEWEEDKPAPAGLSIQLSISSLCRRPCFYRSTEDALQGEKQTKHGGLIG